MSYPLENLSDERFQQFCQALLVREFPTVQCFPVGQPDGGRDAIVRTHSPLGSSFLVFQVKFVRNPSAVANPREWLLDTMKGELDKVRKLVDSSATGYYLLTNVIGSAHFESGSIDKLQVLLSDQLGIPATCWWRDDIERRLDDAWSLKWAYPEIMSGPDFLRAIFESGIRADQARREATLRAFLRDQYDNDSQVRFRQVDLQNGLLDLFVDVPITVGGPFKSPTLEDEFYQTCLRILREETEAEAASHAEIPHLPFHLYGGGQTGVGAASFLLSTSSFQSLVLEGAPGQGKSTISQYLCQVHRIRLLKERHELERLPVAHRTAPVKLPIKVDLRNLAAWVEGENPFTSGKQEDPGKPRQLEPFLATLISRHSGGAHFSVDDLIAILQVSAVCLILDGLDEVADIKARGAVINEIVAGTQRLFQNAASLQVIVTSRPAAFSNSPGMPRSKFQYFVLDSLTPTNITRYLNKWAKARALPDPVRDELRTFIKEKLGQPHIRELARNPMQLAILLSLLYTRGVALPEKRTALYDAYIDHFFGREAEKSATVRSHRDVILDLHKYLAWLMHSESQAKSGRGNLTQDVLINTVADYLSREGRDPQLAKQLFEGMVERVGVLVSRAQGAFEFEVQPLREYFAAKYLFETAPLSTLGNERTGSRPDRFDAIARDAYWLNVARFFAGCYSKGELDALVASLKALCQDPTLGFTNHGRQLAAALASDWVFSQIPRAVREIIDLILEEDGFLRFLSIAAFPRRYSSHSLSLSLSEECGQVQLVEGCFEHLKAHPNYDYEVAICELIRANAAGAHYAQERWLEIIRTAKRNEIARWLRVGRECGFLERLPAEKLLGLPITDHTVHIRELFYAGRSSVIDDHPALSDVAFSLILHGEVDGFARDQLASPFSYMSYVLNPHVYHHALQARPPTSMQKALVRYGAPVEAADQRWRHEQTAGRVGEIKAFADLMDSHLQRPVKEWATSLSIWNEVMGLATRLWGETRALRRLAVCVASVRSGSQVSDRYRALLDASLDLPERTRYARLKGEQPDYWTEIFSEAKCHDDSLFALFLYFAWCPLELVASLLPSIEHHIDMLSEAEYRWLYTRVGRHPWSRRERPRGISELPHSLSARAASILADIVDVETRNEITTRFLCNHPEGDRFLQSHLLRHALGFDQRMTNAKEWTPELDSVAELCAKGARLSPYEYERHVGGKRRRRLGLQAVRKILQSPRLYPAPLVNIAEEQLRQTVVRQRLSVASVANNENWFC